MEPARVKLLGVTPRTFELICSIPPSLFKTITAVIVHVQTEDDPRTDHVHPSC